MSGEEVVVPEGLSEIEGKAWEQGWRPKEQYTGTAPFRDASEFLDVGSKMNSRLKQELEQQKRDLAALSAATTSMLDMQRENYESQIAQLKEQKREAISLGDAEAVDAIEARMGRMKKPAEAVEPTIPSGEQKPAPEVQEFIDRHADWFDKDLVKTRAAVAAMQEIVNTNPGITPALAVRLLDAEVLKMFGATKSVAGTPDVEGGGRSAGGDSGSADAVELDGKRYRFSDMPKDAQEACDLLVRKGVIPDRKSYMKYNTNWSK